MNVKLIARHNGRRTVLPLRTSIAILGRAHGNAVRIPSSDVSRRHCRLICKDGCVTVEDLDSVNGTFLNGKRLKSAQTVYPGDEIEVGPVKFTVDYELSNKARAKLQPNEPTGEILEALADGDVMDVNALDDIPELDVLESKSRNGKYYEEEDFDVLPIQRNATDDLERLEADFDFDATPWQLPEGGDLRDLMHEMEDEPTRPAKSRKRSNE